MTVSPHLSSNPVRLPTLAPAVLAVMLAPIVAAPAVSESATAVASKTAVVLNRGGVDLHGWFFKAESEGPAATAILLHGFPGNPVDPLGLGAALADRGVHALAFNYSGTFDSGGVFSMEATQRDIAAALAFVRDPVNVERFGIDPGRLALGGHSYGGGMALTFASRHPDLRRVFALAPSDSAKIVRDMKEQPDLEARYRQVFAQLEEDGTVRMVAGQLDALMRDPSPWDLRLAAPRLAGRRIFIASGVDDLDTPLETEVLPVYRQLKATDNAAVVLRTYPTDHSFAGVVEQVASDVAAWMLSAD